MRTAVAVLVIVATACSTAGGGGATTTTTDTPATTDPVPITSVTPTSTSGTAGTTPATTSSTAAPPTTTDPAGLVEALFGADRPDLVVVARNGGFEMWSGAGPPTWLAHPLADRDFLQVESGHVAASNLVSPLDDADTALRYDCPSLIDRAGVLLVLERCFEGDSRLTELTTGANAEMPPPLASRCETAGWFERGGVVVRWSANAEGNLCAAVGDGGLSVIGDDVPGFTTLSTGGRLLVYADQGGSVSPHYSRFLVARDVATGESVGTWTFDGVVTCIEATDRWIVVCEGTTMEALTGGIHDHLVAIDVDTGEVRRVESDLRVFLPVAQP